MKAILLIDRRRARELFGHIRFSLEPLTCEDALVYDVSEYYSTLKQVARESFDDQEKARGDHVRFLRFYLEGITSAAQIEPAARLLNEYKLWRDDYAHLVLAFASAVEKVDADPRSFADTLSPLRHNGRQLYPLLSYCQNLRIAAPLWIAWRSYLVRHLGAQRCEDSASIGGEGEVFNKLVARNAEVPSIPGEDVTPGPVAGAPKDQRYWQSLKGKEIRLLLRLQVDPDREVGADLTDVLNSMAGWTSTDEASEADYFHQKCEAYAELLDSIPEGRERDEILHQYIRFLAGSRLKRESTPEWLLHVKNLLEEAPASALPMMQQSGDAALALQAALARPPVRK